MDLTRLSDPVMASLIGAGATVLTALVQLRLSWRKELKERERGQPISKKTRRGPVMLVLALMIAAAVGGFALSQYLMSWRNSDRDELRTELQTKLDQISATAARLEQARLNEYQQMEMGIRRAEALRMGEEGATGSVVVAPCKSEAGAKHECTEKTAVRVSVCARVPQSASVKEVVLYTRFEDSQQPWPDARVQAGQDAGQAKFLEKFSERPDLAGAKQVCQGFEHWNGEKSRLARILVKYTL